MTQSDKLLTDYRVTSPYGPRKSPIDGGQEFHTGIDLVSPPFSYIQTFVPGTVVHAQEGQKGTGLGGFGVTVIIKDKYNHLHMYAHLTDCCVTVGQFVEDGKNLGRQGNTGKSAGQHLHYEVRKNGPSFGFGNHLHPIKYLNDYYAKEPTCPQENKKSVDKAVEKPRQVAVSISLNGKLLPVSGFLENGVSMLPVRALVTAAGGKLEWIPATKDVRVNGKDLNEKIITGSAYAPTRELAAALGLQVEWDQENKTVKLKRCV